MLYAYSFKGDFYTQQQQQETPWLVGDCAFCWIYLVYLQGSALCEKQVHIHVGIFKERCGVEEKIEFTFSLVKISIARLV